MAFDRGILNRYRYFRGGGQLDQAFIENVLLPGLAAQTKFTGGAIGIELPHGDNTKPEDIEYIPIKEAAEIAIDWFGEHKNLESSEERSLERLLGNASYRQIADILQLVLRSRVDDPQKLLRARLTQNVAELKHIQELEKIEAKSSSQYHPATDLRQFYKLQLEVSRLAAMGVPANYLAQLLPASLVKNIDPTLTQRSFLNILTNHPELLQQVKIDYGDDDINKANLTRSLEKIVRQYPEYSGLLNFTAMDEFRDALYLAAKKVNQKLDEENISLNSYADAKIRASYALPHLLPHQSELYNQLKSLKTFTDPTSQEAFARTTLNLLVATANQPLTGDDLLRLVGKKLNLTNDQLTSIQNEVHLSGLLPALEVVQNSAYFDLTARRLTSSEKWLQARGINPTHINDDLPSILGEAQKILSEPGLTPQDARLKIQRLYEHELSSSNPSQVELFRLRSWLDRHDTLSFLELPQNSQLKRLASRSRFERGLTDFANRLRSLETKFYNKWFEINEKLPWNVVSRKLFEWYDKKAEEWVLAIPLGKGKKLNLPIFNFGNFVLDQWDKFKISSTSKAVKYVSGKNWGAFEGFRKTIVLALREYRLGGHTTSGAIFHYTHKLWGKTLTWAAAKAGLPSLAKYPASWAARVLIKIGGKSLAKVGVKAITAIAAAATAIGSVLSVVMAIGLVFDLLKMGYDFVKRFFNDIEFRKLVTKISLGIAAISTFVNSLRFGSVIFALLGTLAVGLLTAAMWAVGLVIGVGLIYNTLQTTARLDVGTSDLQIPSGGSTTVDCFTFVEAGKTFPKNSDVNPSSTTPGWSPSDIALMTAAIEKMKSSHGKFIEAVCRGGNINLWRDVASAVSWGGWAMSGGDIRLYNLGVTSALYTLSHELGHIYAVRVGGVGAFMGAGLVVWDTITGTCKNNIYPANPTSEGMCYGENFAELVSWVISGHKSPPGSWAQWVYSNVFK